MYVKQLDWVFKSVCMSVSSIMPFIRKNLLGSKPYVRPITTILHLFNFDRIVTTVVAKEDQIVILFFNPSRNALPWPGLKKFVSSPTLCKRVSPTKGFQQCVCNYLLCDPFILSYVPLFTSEKLVDVQKVLLYVTCDDYV